MQQQLVNFFNEIEQALIAKKPFVVFNKPNKNGLTLYKQNSLELFELENYHQKGFVFAPFSSSEKQLIFPESECEKLTTTFNFEEINNNKQKEVIEIISSSKNEKEYNNLVSDAVNFINTTSAEKVVVSRKEIVSKSNFEVIATFKKMLNNYKNAFVYCWHHPKVGLWMGASPERFLNIENGEFKTMSLAGTQVYVDTVKVNWKEKEKEEQRYVTDFIIDSVSPIFKEVKIKGPYTVKAGSLLHLRTDILAKVTSNDLIEKLALKLHPTPAVCGLPKQKAKDFIIKNEGYNRTYYTGFLGELNIENSTNFYVNLRCMQIDNSTISIYIGGGITKSSIAKLEWNETVSKAEIMKKVL
ncbi:isochorismate synthase [Lutibacter oricola]|uniref:isochorismate synthase n=1 Tax=Lutibacter oricola TaxID=762486 RepID=A0A1H3AF96_9FLAO|nr:chorismate-binding protein [Lutibacter oricola]SDX27844.1 isochorismate synthase [Lutibacter oricola]